MRHLRRALSACDESGQSQRQLLLLYVSSPSPQPKAIRESGRHVDRSSHRGSRTEQEIDEVLQKRQDQPPEPQDAWLVLPDERRTG
jgi:hypothetical protein